MKLSQDWLVKQSVEQRPALLIVLLLQCAYIACKIGALWALAQSFAALLIQRQPVSVETLKILLVSSIGMCIAYAVLAQVRTQLKMTYQQSIHQQLSQDLAQASQHQIRSQSMYAWQQIWLQHIPTVANYLFDFVVQKWLSALIPLLVIGIITAINWLIGIALLVTLPLLPVFMILVGKGTAHRHQAHFQALADLGTLFADRLRNSKLLAQFKHHDAQAKILDQASTAYNIKTMHVLTLAFVSSSLLDFFSTLSIAIIAVYIGFSLLGEIDFGISIQFVDGMFILLVVPLLFAELKRLGQLYHQKEAAIAASAALEVDLTYAPTEVANQAIARLDELVSSTSTPPKPHWIALTGPSGAGKTRLLQGIFELLLRDPSSLQLKVAMLTQESVILPGSIRENVCLDREYPTAEIIHVLTQVGLAEWLLQQPQGLATEMGDYPPLSGGEARRIALARIMLLDVDIVLLDEPTAFLTAQLHNEISGLMHTVFAHKHVIWVSHKGLPPTWFTEQWRVSESGELIL
ncbi:MAG: ABC transporter transmembrane domain-containing protein [Glaciecola sp.]|nr:ABC transporter transmembrane domain-containing protein [Glaciecola sp.]MDG1815632.1 ABC transporter transmembrane domain-containing protein [Glaciecola sp.]MDG2098151.1 ABC transporter transmembrane domain-containing protein [Glaciecola sp.]